MNSTLKHSIPNRAEVNEKIKMKVKRIKWNLHYRRKMSGSFDIITLSMENTQSEIAQND